MNQTISVYPIANPTTGETTEYNDIPTMMSEAVDLDDFIVTHSLEIVSRTDDTIVARSEYGNGEGWDYVQIDLHPHHADKKVSVGDSVEIVEHARYQHLVGNASLVTPVEHAQTSYKTTVRAIFVDEGEDAQGNIVKAYTYEMADGKQYEREQFKLIKE